MLCLLKGNGLYIRSQNWSATEDFVWKCLLANNNWWAGNPYFNIDAACTCPSDDAPDCLAHLKLWKESHDDICALGINNSALHFGAAGKGYLVVKLYPIT